MQSVRFVDVGDRCVADNCTNTWWIYYKQHSAGIIFFILLALMGCGILTAAWFIMPDGRAADITLSLKPAPILSNFATVLKEPQFLTYSLTGAAASAGLYAYIAGSPYVFMELYKVSERGYGWIFATIAGGLITCSQLNSLLLRTYRSEQIIRVAAFCQSMTGLVLFVATILNMLNVYGTIALIFVFLVARVLFFLIPPLCRFAPFTKNAGSASALLGSIQLGIGTLSSAMVTVLNDHTALPMAEVMAISTLTAFIVLISGIVEGKLFSLNIEHKKLHNSMELFKNKLVD